MWLVQSVFERVDVIGRLTVRHRGILLNFHMWIGVKNFRPEFGVKFFIHEIFHTWNRCEFSIRHVQPCSTCEILNLHTFQTCFWCESGMKQAWSYENILYGNNRKRLTPCRCFDEHIKEPYEISMAWDPERRSNFFSLPAHVCAVTITDISSIVTLSNQY